MTSEAKSVFVPKTDPPMFPKRTGVSVLSTVDLYHA